MAGSTEFLTWAVGAGANVVTQSAYASNPAQGIGVSAGIAVSALYNKAQRQSAFVVSGIANYIAEVLQIAIPDDGNLTGFASNLWQALLGGSYFVDIGTASALLTANPTAPLGITFPAPIVGLRVTVKTAAACTGATTFNWMGTGNKSVVYADGSVLRDGDYPAGAILDVEYDGTSWQLLTLSPSAVHNIARELLTADTTYYCNFATGSDTTGNGTSGSPWKTLQHAYDTLQATIDGAGFSVTISQSGTDTGGLIAAGTIPGAPILTVTINGAVSTVTTEGIQAFQGARLRINGTGTIQGGTFDVAATGHSYIEISGVTLDACSDVQLYSQEQSTVFITGGMTFSGNCIEAIAAETGSTITAPQTTTLTISGSPVYSAGFARGSACGSVIIDHTLVTFSGTATGPRYNVSTGGGIYTNGGGASFLPGSTAGTADATTYGWYA